MKKIHLRMIVPVTLVALMVLAQGPAAYALNIVWTGAGGSDWSVPGNWNAGVPGPADTAFIVDGAATPATVSSAVPTVVTVHVGQGGGDGHVVVAAGGDLTAANMSLGTDSARAGTLDVTGGLLTLTTSLSIGNNNAGGAGGPSTANLSGGTVTVTDNLYVGAGGLATGSAVTQSGATVSASNLRVGSGSAANYSISSGSLTLSNAVTPEFGSMILGQGAVGTFTQTGGTVTTTGGHFAVGLFQQGFYNMPVGSTGVVNINGGGQLLVGNEGASGGSTFDQDDGTVNSNALTIIGRGGGGPATYDISGGALNTPALNVGTSAASSGSSFIQSGGTVTVPNILLGINGGAGSYTQSGGTLDTTGTLQIGGNGAGAAGSLLAISGGTLNAGAINPGAFVPGSMTVSGTADVNVTGSFQVGATPGAAGSALSQSGGTIDASTLFVGVGGSGSFNLSGGITTLGSLNVAQGTVNGAVTHTGGSLVSTNVLVGVAGTGTYDLSAGSITAAGGVVSVGRGTGGNGTLNQTGGSITGDRLDIGGDLTVADVSSGIVNMSGGTINTAGGITLDTVAPQVGSTGEFNLSGTASYSGEFLIVGDNLSAFPTVAPGGDGTLSLTGPNVSAVMGGVWIGASGTYEVNSGSGISTLQTVAPAAVSGGTFLFGDLALNLGTLGVASDLLLIENVDPTAGVTGIFNGLPEGTLVVDSSGLVSGNITYQYVGSGDAIGNDVALINVSVVPEPASAMILGIGCLGMLVMRKRRR